MTSARTRRILGVSLTLLVVLAVAPFVVYAVPEAVGADRSYVVLSGSMEPAISPGDVVIVGAVDPASLAVGDVITFQRTADSVAVTHRIVEVGGSVADGSLSFLTEGDANEDPDPAPVPADAVVGKVVLTLPYIGYVVQFAGTTAGMALLVGVPVVLLVGDTAYRWHRRRQAANRPYGPFPAPEPAPNGAAAADDRASGTGTDPSVVTIGPGTDLTLTYGVLGILAVYSAATGYRTGLPDAWVMTAIALVLAGGLYVLTNPPGAGTRPSAGTGTGTGAGTAEPEEAER